MSNLASRFINGAMPASSTDLFPSRMERTQLQFHFHDPAPFCPKDVSIYIYIYITYTNFPIFPFNSNKIVGSSKECNKLIYDSYGEFGYLCGISLVDFFEVTAAVKNDPAAFQWASKVGPLIGGSQKRCG